MSWDLNAPLTEEDRKAIAAAMAWDGERPDREVTIWAARLAEDVLRWMHDHPRLRLRGESIRRVLEPYLSTAKMIVVVERITGQRIDAPELKIRRPRRAASPASVAVH